jgi:hypothetical protein
MSYIFLVLAGLFLIVLVRRLIPRAYMYYYIYDGERRYKVLLGYVKSDGTVIDIHNPRGARRVGQVYARQGCGIVRLYRYEDTKQYDEVGYVTPEGEIYTGTPSSPGRQIGVVDSNGSRKWYELWLLLHADVPKDDTMPFGHCIETGRFRHCGPYGITLLARGAAILFLYYKVAKPDEEPAERRPALVWNTALPAALIFAITYVPLYYLTQSFTLLPFLGREISLTISLYAVYLATWLVFHLLKEFLLTESDIILDYLMLLNRNTGIKRWNRITILGCLIGLVWSIFVAGYAYVPLFAALATGLIINHMYVTASLWPVRSPYISPLPTPGGEGEITGQETRLYHWELDSPVRSLSFTTSLKFDPGEVISQRSINPFFQNWAQASQQLPESCREIARNGKDDRHVKEIARFMVEQAAAQRLTPFEMMQAILDFAQEPNIQYRLDSECEELNGSQEYVRFPLETLYDKRGDCDCKAMLAASLFHAAGFPVIFLVGPGHAAVAVGGAPDLDVEGIIIWNNKRYYYCETTGDHWTIGKIPGDQLTMIDQRKTEVIEI